MSMRLTLRTLLAYLDDTLEPNAAKLIGQKVAESETAQELIARIKEVTRRRRITTPASGGPGAKVDPDTIAAYLDNELSPEALAEVEQVALASDVHLAEIAACHQILTIVLGEPAVVPPTAYRRIYGLVKPPESNPQHQPPQVRESEEAMSEGKEVDETLRLGLPALFGRGGVTNRVVLIGGAVCVLALLCLAIWNLLPPGGHESEGDGTIVAKASDGPKTPRGKGFDSKSQPGPKDEAVTSPKKDADPKAANLDKGKLPEGKNKTPDPKETPPADKDKKVEDEAPAPPNETVRAVGHFEPPSPPGAAVLLQLLPDMKQPDRKQWTRLLRTKDPAQVLTNAPLLSLPGYHSNVILDNGVRLTLWGNVPEIYRYPPFACECLVTIHPNDRFDLDLTLFRGRMAFANLKEQPAKVRVRFANPTNPASPEIWDFTLQEKGTEIVLNLYGLHPPGEQFVPNKDDPKRKEPVAVMWMVVKSGKASLKRDLQSFDKLMPPPAGQQMIWNSREGTPRLLKADGPPAWIQDQPPLPKELEKQRAEVLSALAALNSDLTGYSVDVGLEKAMKTNDIAKRRLAVRCAGALGDFKRVIDTLAHPELEVRWAAIETLRMEIGADRDNDYKLYDQLQPTYSATDATIIMSLLHRWIPANEADDLRIKNMLVDYLTHDKLAIRQLAIDYLLSLPDLYEAGVKIGYNAAGPDFAQRAKQWRLLVQKGEKK